MPVIKIRRGTSTQWATSNRVLQLGELGLDTTLNKLKAGNGTTAWSSLPFLQADADVTELAQDAVATALANGTHSNITVTYDDATNKISLATGPDVITQTSLSNTLTNATTGYVPIADVGSADGVASLDSSGKVPDSEIPAGIARLASPTFTGTVAGITKNMVGLGNVDNTSDANKPVSTATTTALGLKANLASPALTGTPTAPLAATGTNTTQIATTSFVQQELNVLTTGAPAALNTLDELAAALGDDANYAATITTALGAKSPIASPTFTGTVTIPAGASISGFAPLASPTFTGTVSGITKSMVGLGNVDNTTDANKPVSTATQTALDAKSNQIVTINAQTSSYTLATTDLDKMIEMSGGGTLTITDSASFSVGFTCNILQTGSSQVTIAGTGFTPDSTPGLKLRTQWSSATLVKRALNSWVVMGDLSA